MAFYKSKKKTHSNTLYEEMLSGRPLTKQALSIMGDELAEKATKSEAEEKQEQINNPKIRYARDKFGIVHDKECYKVTRYPLHELKWMEDVGVNFTLCKECNRKALIRRAIEDVKKLDEYIKFFNRHNVSYYHLRELCLIRNAKIRLLGNDTLWIKEREDEWKIEYDYEHDNFILWHNNYSVKGKKRYMTGDYHRQEIKMNKTFAQVVHNVFTYNSKLHLPLQERAENERKLTEETVNVESKSGFSYFDNLLTQKSCVSYHRP